MKNGPRPGLPSKTNFVAKARAAWGEEIPDWILTLAEEATRTSGKAVAQRLDYSSSVISTVLGRSYPGDYARIEQVVRGAFMGASVDCPVLGSIGRDRCLSEQGQPFRASSAFRAQLFHACNMPGRCPHSKKTAAAQAERSDA